jgi:hypothetical protein
MYRLLNKKHFGEHAATAIAHQAQGPNVFLTEVDEHVLELFSDLTG